jgi:hypothetical protein
LPTLHFPPENEQQAIWPALVREALAGRQSSPADSEVQRLSRTLARLHPAASQALQAAQLHPADEPAAIGFIRALDALAND